MSQVTRSELVSKYFVPTPKPPSYAGPYTALIGGGGALLFALIAIASEPGAGLACLAALAIVGGVVGLGWGAKEYLRRYTAYRDGIRRAQPKATGAQMDGWLAEGVDYIADVGRRRLNLHPGDASEGRGKDVLTFTGIPVEVRNLQAAYGEDDGVLRSSQYKVLVVYLTGWRLSTYESILDMRTGATISDQTKEFHLQQVDGVETASDRINILLSGTDGHRLEDGARPVGQGQEGLRPSVHLTGAQTFRLVVSGRPAIELYVDIADSERVHVEGASRAQTDEMIGLLREHLRRHMGGVQAPPSAAQLRSGRAYPHSGLTATPGDA